MFRNNLSFSSIQSQIQDEVQLLALKAGQRWMLIKPRQKPKLTIKAQVWPPVSKEENISVQHVFLPLQFHLQQKTHQNKQCMIETLLIVLTVWTEQIMIESCRLMFNPRGFLGFCWLMDDCRTNSADRRSDALVCFLIWALRVFRTKTMLHNHSRH